MRSVKSGGDASYSVWNGGAAAGGRYTAGVNSNEYECTVTTSKAESESSSPRSSSASKAYAG